MHNYHLNSTNLNSGSASILMFSLFSSDFQLFSRLFRKFFGTFLIAQIMMDTTVFFKFQSSFILLQVFFFFYIISRFCFLSVLFSRLLEYRNHLKLFSLVGDDQIRSSRLDWVIRLNLKVQRILYFCRIKFQSFTTYQQITFSANSYSFSTLSQPNCLLYD